MKKLLVRVDAGSRMGMGHVMRCLALAQAWQEAGGEAAFLMAPGGDAIHPTLQSEGLQILSLASRCGTVEDAHEAAAAASNMDADWIVVDGYQFNAEYQRILKDAGRLLLFFDDYGHCDHYCADIVLNQNPQASEDLYPSREPSTRLLVGVKYALMRREFRCQSPSSRDFPDTAGKILVTLGGSDPENVTLKVMEALRALTIPGETRVLVGPMNANLAILEAAAGRGIELIKNTYDLPGLMRWADMAVSAAGSTSLETCYMGLPSLLLVVIENQRSVADGLDKCGAALNLGLHSVLTPRTIGHRVQRLLESKDQRMALSRRGREVVDGDGASRVLSAILNQPIASTPRYA